MFPELGAFTQAFIALFVLGGGVGLLGPSRLGKARLTALSLSLACLGGAVAAGGALALDKGSPPVELFHVARLTEELPALALELYLDPLAAFFLFLTGAFSVGVTLYSFVWLRDVPDRQRVAGVYNLFVLSLLLLVLANNVYFFLLCLECMTLNFAFLVLYRHNKLLEEDEAPAEEMEAAKLAFKTYLVSSHVGVVLITTALILLSFFAKSLSFDALRELTLSGQPVTASLIFVLALAGLGIKAGMAPFHVWLPLAHPYSPTNIHAMLSGLAIKVGGIYGMLRLFFEFLRPVPWWWGAVLLGLAGLTAIVGVFYAIASRDLKTALANHSVENIGIILAGIGLALIFASDSFAGQPTIAGLAGLPLVAALYHTLNHALFKGLLFLCTGAIENRTGTVEIEALGGLMRRYPWTSITFLVGATSIAGFPPFNGFISEWLTLQSFLAGMALFSTDYKWWLLLVLVATLLLLGLAFGLTALAFVKIVGETLLGVPRRPQVVVEEKPGEVPWPMRAVLAVLAILCLGLGLLPGWVIGRLGSISSELGHSLPFASDSATHLLLTPSTAYTAELNILPLLILLIVPALVVIAAARRHKDQTRSTPVWTCGTPYDPASMQITGGAFSSLVWERLGGALPADAVTSPQWHGQPLPVRFFLSHRRYVSEVFAQVYNWGTSWLVSTSERLGDWFQNGDIRRYLLYILAAFLLVLVISLVNQ